MAVACWEAHGDGKHSGSYAGQGSHEMAGIVVALEAQTDVADSDFCHHLHVDASNYRGS